MSYRTNHHFRLELVDAAIKSYASKYYDWARANGVSIVDMLKSNKSDHEKYQDAMKLIRDKLTLNYKQENNKLTVYLIIRVDESEGENTTQKACFDIDDIDAP